MAKLDPKLGKWTNWIAVIQRRRHAGRHGQGCFLVGAEPHKRKPRHTYSQHSSYWYMGNTYVAYALTGIRRQVKPQKDSIDLKQLLTEIVQEPDKVSRRLLPKPIQQRRQGPLR